MQPAQSPNAPTVVVLGTGGTIAGRSDVTRAGPGYRAGVVGIDALVGALAPLGVAVRAESVDAIDSKDLRPELWRRLALRLRELLADDTVAGCVVTHGSDTLEETAWALQRLLPPGKPVVLTASMLPADAVSADGPRNLRDAIRVAADPRSWGRGVLCVLHGRIHGARDVVKADPCAVDAFASGPRGPLGFVRDATLEYTRVDPEPSPPTLAPPGAQAPWPRVELVVSHAGVDGAVVRALVEASRRGELLPPLAGLVVLGTGGGTVHEDLEAALATAAAAGVRVRRASRVGALPGDAGLNAVKLRVDLQLELAAAAAAPPAGAPGAVTPAHPEV